MAALIHAIVQVVRQRWWLGAVVSSAVAVTAACARIFESDAERKKRDEARKKKALRAVADRIASYGQNVRQRFPNGAVVVSEEDLALQLRKRPDSVATALNVLLKEQKAQRTHLTGYWRLNS